MMMPNSYREPLRGWQCPNVWGRIESWSGNEVKQLLVPAGRFGQVTRGAAGMEMVNNFGRWPAATPDQPPREDTLWIRLPVGTAIGDTPTRAEWSRPARPSRNTPNEVLASYGDALRFREGTDEVPGLRSPQLGAVHAVLGYWTTKRDEPATVVMPTGTGKTETMLALLVAARPTRLLILVPSDALREQIAGKFETLGVLQELGVVANNALRPVVGRIKHRFERMEDVIAFTEACNVVVATPQSLQRAEPAVLSAIADRCSHLFIDEAHHVAATTWSRVRAAFAGRSVVQFTATPFREDGAHLQGRIIYSFPLREAQMQGYFSTIAYTSVIDFDDVDRAVAEQSLNKLCADLDSGFDHVLMARVSSIDRATEVKAHYDAIAPELGAAVIHSRLSKRDQKAALEALQSRQSRAIVCVDMLGEGFDLPALKVAAVHDPHRSLAVTLQFIGRFARTSSHGNYGEASIFVARRKPGVDDRLRELYAEDSDWNALLRVLTESAVDEQQEVSDFEEGFTGVPEEVALQSLLPKMSTVVYKCPSDTWDPQGIIDFFGRENMLTERLGHNPSEGIAWAVLQRRSPVRWGDVKTIEEITYELYVLYFDARRQLLYINNSANDGVFQELADAVAGPGSQRFTGSTVYRVMADIDRLVPTNVGVLDSRDQFRRFSMHVGSDVTESFSQAEAGTKAQTNISGGGYRNGDRVSISASRKGRIWSHAAAPNLKQWRDWCDSIGDKLLDESISIEKVIGNFILPQPLKGRPEGVLLAAEWPWSIHALSADTLKLRYEGKAFELVYTDLVPDTTRDTGNFFRFAVSTSAWTIPYEAEVVHGRLHYRCAQDDEPVVLRNKTERPLSDWLNENGLLFVLDDDRIVENDQIFKPTWDRQPYDPTRLTALDWTGTDLTVESQTGEKLEHSIQHRAIRELKREDWDLIVDDDGAGEIADLVAIRATDGQLVVKLIHCKFSRSDEPGARVADLYEVCGQAQKSIMWRRNDLETFFNVLTDRAQKKQRREGVSPFEVGDAKKLFVLRDRSRILRRRFEIVIAQPGLSAGRASNQQLDLIASTEAYLKTTIKAGLEVWCSQ